MMEMSYAVIKHSRCSLHNAACIIHSFFSDSYVLSDQSTFKQATVHSVERIFIFSYLKTLSQYFMD